MNNKSCMVRPTLIDMNPDELFYYPFIISLDRCDGSCKAVKDPSVILCVRNNERCKFKTFNWINDSKTVGKHIFCGYTCEFGSRKCNSKPKWNNDKCQFECKTLYT